VTNPNAEPNRRASMILVPLDTPGVSVEDILCMGQRGNDWAGHARVSFRCSFVPRTYLLGEEGAGFALAQARLGPGRIHHCMRWIGVAERAFDLLCECAVSREIAPGEKLAGKQTIQNWIAESRAEIHAARLLVLHVAWRIDREGARAAREEISLIKFTAA